MREIKFKVHYLGTQKTKPCVAIRRLGSSCWIRDKVFIGDSWRKLDKCNVYQYTGLKDKNGVEIYEGDIVSYNNGQYIFEIEWTESMVGFDYKETEEYHDKVLSPYSQFAIEVIGNIYENPELIEKLDKLMEN